jgi:hypothetical protein
VLVKDAANDLSSGGVCKILAHLAPVDDTSGTDGTSTWKQLATTNIDTGHDAAFGFRTGTNISSPYVQMYDATGNSFDVYAVAFDGQVSTETSLFSVGRLGGVTAVGIIRTSAAHVATKKRNSGTLTFSSSSFSVVDSANLDITLDAIEGDIIAIHANGAWAATGAASYLDVSTQVSGSPVNYVSTGTGTAATSGVSGWQGVASVSTPFGGTILYTVQAGDLSGGTVTLRLRAAVSSGSRDLAASSGTPLFFSAQNLG